MNDISNLENDLGKELEELSHFYQVDLPEFAAARLEKLVDDSFRKEQYQGDTKSKWDGRKLNKEDYTKAGNAKRRSRRRGLLVQSGDLVRSVEASIDRGEEITVSIASDKIYAQIHNEGLMGKAWGKHPFKMPQRQFMPIPGTEENVITQDLETFIDKSLDQIFQ